VKALARALYSTSSSYGARIVSVILNDPVKKLAWLEQCGAMASRLNESRQSLYDGLVENNVKGTWKHIITQRGMFTFSGIQGSVVKRLKEEFHIYMLMDGRISLAGLNRSNVLVFVKALLTILGQN
jgi:aspartate/tyrosine/aromatic aminotransferase